MAMIMAGQKPCFFILKKKVGIVSMEGKGLWINAEIMGDTRLNMTEKALLAEIHNLAQVGEVFAGNEHFATMLELSKNRVSHLIAYLKSLNLITIELTYKTGTKEIEKRIITPIVENNNTPCSFEQDPIVENNNTPIVENSQDKKQVFKKQIKKQIKDKNIYEHEFELLWNIYPNKKGRDKAKQAYIKARQTKTEYETVKIGLEMYVKYVQTQQTDKQYIKHGSTWFNQRSWLDDYTIKPKRPTGFFGLYQDETEKAQDNSIIFEYDEQGDLTHEQNGRNQDFDDFAKLFS